MDAAEVTFHVAQAENPSRERKAYEDWLDGTSRTIDTLNATNQLLLDAVQNLESIPREFASRYTSLSRTAVEEAQLWLTQYSVTVPPEHMVEHNLAMANGVGGPEPRTTESSGPPLPPASGDAEATGERIDIP